jgi:hypothetical protein
MDESMAQGSTSRFFANVNSYYSGAHDDVTESAVWACSDPAVATISNDPGSKGLATPVGPGTTTVTAEWEDLSVSTSLTVRPWTIRSTGTTELLNDLALSESLLVAVGTNGTIVTSPDAVDWSIQDSGTTANLTGITWTGTRFVAVTDNSLVLTSPDAITWSSQDSGTSIALRDVAWSGTGFVAVGFNGIISSPDGVNWTTRPASLQYWNEVASDGTTFVAAGDYGVLHSQDDGVTWEECTGSLDSRSDVTWTGDCFMAVGHYGSLITSPGGSTWTLQQISGIEWIYSVAGTGDHYIIVARRLNDAQPLIGFSSNGTDWDVQLAKTDRLTKVVWCNGEYVALMDGGRIVTIPPPTSAAMQIGETTHFHNILPAASSTDPMTLQRRLLMTQENRR